MPEDIDYIAVIAELCRLGQADVLALTTELPWGIKHTQKLVYDLIEWDYVATRHGEWFVTPEGMAVAEEHHEEYLQRVEEQKRAVELAEQTAMMKAAELAADRERRDQDYRDALERIEQARRNKSLARQRAFELLCRWEVVRDRSPRLVPYEDVECFLPASRDARRRMAECMMDPEPLDDFQAEDEFPSNYHCHYYLSTES